MLNVTIFKMNCKILASLLFGLIFFMVSCSKPNPQEAWKKLAEQEISATDSTKLRALEEDLYNFYKNYPESAEAPQALFKSARLLESRSQDQEALERYAQVDYRYPQSAEAAQAMFLAAFLYNNKLSDTAKARSGYESFLNRFPAHELSAAARFELNAIGKTPDLLLFNSDTTTFKLK
jgi:hypothetical protein